MRCFTLCLVASLLCSAASGQTAPYQRIETIAGTGRAEKLVQAGEAAKTDIANPFGIAEAADGSLIICSFDWHVLYRLDADRRRLSIIAGSGHKGLAGSPGESALRLNMNQPHEVQIDSSGNVLIADTMNHRVIQVVHGDQTWQPVAGTGAAGFDGDGGLATKALLNQAYSIGLDRQQLFVVDLQNHRLRQVDLATGLIQTICGRGQSQLPTDGALAVDEPLADPRSIAVDGENIWIVLRGGHSVWRLDRSSQRIYHVAGIGKKGYSGDGGNAKLATFNGPKGIAVDPGKALYIADTENHAIRQIDLTTGIISTLVGSSSAQKGFNGDGDDLTSRTLNRPHGICLLRSGELVIGDSENHRVRILKR